MQISPKTSRIIGIVGCALLALYVLTTCVWANRRAANELCTGLENDRVGVDDALNTGFVTSEELTAEIAPMLGNLTDRRLSDVDLDSLQRYLTALDKIETAQVMALTDGRIRVNVVPMVPVARVWPRNGHSYYVNREGKSIKASARYRLDVPQVEGTFSPSALMPLLTYLQQDADADKFITMISASDTTNIILVPAIRGHVINLGDASDVAGKFSRLRQFYAEVLPAKGWEYYDTISLKWDNQIVATRRHGKLPDLSVPVIGELENEGDDLETVMAPGMRDTTETNKANKI